MHKLKKIAKLCGLNRYMNIYSIFIPCLWLIAWGQYYLKSLDFIKKFLLFLVISVLIYCIHSVFNFIFNKNIDKFVKKSKDNVIASNELSLSSAFSILFLLLIIVFYLLFLLKPIAIFFTIFCVAMVFVYPFIKRTIEKSQILLGAIFAMPGLISYCDVANKMTYSAIMLYFASMYWITICNTIYYYNTLQEDVRFNICYHSILNEQDQKKYFKALLSFCMIMFFIAGFIDNLQPQIWYYIFVFLFIGFMVRIITLTNLNDNTSRRANFVANMIIGIGMYFIFYFFR